ncbi:MAG TPA: hypothetical protein VMT24_19570 [Aggregatilineaceae bacterium]|nr:hypothetical protein [Aggregatilineaceae bacterium]
MEEICEYWQRLAREVHAFIAELEDFGVARDQVIRWARRNIISPCGSGS